MTQDDDGSAIRPAWAKKDPVAKADSSRLVCHCFHVTEDAIRTAIHEHNLTSIDAIRMHCLCSMGCGCCRDEVEEIAREELGDSLQ